jgi:hypothetical protein
MIATSMFRRRKRRNVTGLRLRESDDEGGVFEHRPFQEQPVQSLESTATSSTRARDRTER